MPELEAVVADGRNAPLDGVRDRDRLFEAVCAVIGAAAAAEPVVLVIEDLHWADETSVALLATLARAVPTMACLLVVTVRDLEIAPDRRALLRAIEGGALRLPLAPLSADETAALVQALSGAATPPVQFASQLVHRTGGNPLFVVETLRALFEQGTLSAEADGRGWTTTAGTADGDYADLPVPESIAQIVDARLERLQDDARTLADAASVLRRDFDFDVVQRASGLGAVAALDGLDALLTSGLWREAASEGTSSDGISARYDFAHALVRDRIYARLSAARRQHLHRQVAGLLETNHPEQPDRVAYHYLRGGVRDRACAWSLRAGDAAIAVYAADNALTHYRTARQLAASAAEQFAALSGAGHAFVALGRAREAVLTYTEALTHAPDDGARAEIERCIGRAYERRGEFDAAIAAYLRARDHLRSHPATLAALRTADGLATVYIRLGRVDEALALGKDALTVLAVSNGLSDDERLQPRHGCGTRSAWPICTAISTRRRWRRLARACCSSGGSAILPGRATVLGNLGVVHYHAGDDDAALGRYGRASPSIAIADHYDADRAGGAWPRQGRA
ncbi:MAG: tetratricopeptide repeat protein [Anaerolineae bacterium]